MRRMLIFEIAPRLYVVNTLLQATKRLRILRTMTDIMEVLQRDLTPRQRSLERIYSRKSIEQAFLETFELVGGVSRLATWANDEENYKDFLKLLMVLAPKAALEEKVGNVIEYRSNIPQSPLNRPASNATEIVIDSTDT